MNEAACRTVIDVSIIIVNYNTQKQLFDCITSIYQHTRDITFEIIVSDNASTDGTGRMIARYFPGVICIKNDVNLGFGRANNAGALHAKGTFLFLLNSDTVLLNNAAAQLVRFMRAHSDCGAAGGNLYDEQLQPLHSFRRTLPSLFWELNALLFDYPEKILYKENREFNHNESPLRAAYITGADLMIRHELWRQLEGFNPAFFMYYEDAELCRRIARRGYTMYSVPDAKIMHLSGKSFSVKEQQELLHLESRKLYFTITKGAFYYYLVSMLSSLDMKLKILVAKLRRIDELFTFYTEKKRIFKLFKDRDYEKKKIS